MQLESDGPNKERGTGASTEKLWRMWGCVFCFAEVDWLNSRVNVHVATRKPEEMLQISLTGSLLCRFIRICREGVVTGSAMQGEFALLLLYGEKEVHHDDDSQFRGGFFD